jgi:hypothetical protein
MLDPGDHIWLREPGEKIHRVGDGDGADEEPPSLLVAQHPHAVVRVT